MIVCFVDFILGAKHTLVEIRGKTHSFGRIAKYTATHCITVIRCVTLVTLFSLLPPVPEKMPVRLEMVITIQSLIQFGNYRSRSLLKISNENGLRLIVS